MAKQQSNKEGSQQGVQKPDVAIRKGKETPTPRPPAKDKK